MFKEGLKRFLKAHGIAVAAVLILSAVLKFVLHYSFILSFIILLAAYFGIGFAIELISEKYRLAKAGKQLGNGAGNQAVTHRRDAGEEPRPAGNSTEVRSDVRPAANEIPAPGRNAGTGSRRLRKLSSDIRSIEKDSPGAEGGTGSARNDSGVFFERKKEKKIGYRAESLKERRGAVRSDVFGSDDAAGENTSEFIKNNDLTFRKYARRNASTTAKDGPDITAGDAEDGRDAVDTVVMPGIQAAEGAFAPGGENDAADRDAGDAPEADVPAGTGNSTGIGSAGADNGAPGVTGSSVSEGSAAGNGEETSPGVDGGREDYLLFDSPDIAGDTEFSEGITESVNRMIDENRPFVQRRKYILSGAAYHDSRTNGTNDPAKEPEETLSADQWELRSHISKDISKGESIFDTGPDPETEDMVNPDKTAIDRLFGRKDDVKPKKPSLEEYRRRSEKLNHPVLNFRRSGASADAGGEKNDSAAEPDGENAAVNGETRSRIPARTPALTKQQEQTPPQTQPQTQTQTQAQPRIAAESAAKAEDEGEMIRPLIDREEPERKAVRQISRKYQIPPVDLLSGPRGTDNTGTVNAEDDPKAQKLISTLESFGVGAKIIGIMRGPAVTRYELQPNPGVKVSRIVALADDIALNLASTGVRIEAPVPGKEAVGIEVPNQQVEIVALRQVIESPEFRSSQSALSVALGRDIAGKNIVADISKMPHLLIAGATGSGKSVCINTIVASILYKSGPADVRMIMIDPKIVELGVYNGIPHLLVPVVTNPKKAAGALSWAVGEMERRYTAFSEHNVRDIRAYNALAAKETGIAKMPQILIIIDELADLMMVAAKEIEESIIRLAQKARAAGLHIIIATQRPSVDVITGLIKANIPSRIAFAVTSQIDSRTILDGGGAEKLLGRGDMLFHPIGMSKPLRVQGAFVSDAEIEALADNVRNSYGTAEYSEEIQSSIDQKEKSQPSGGQQGDNADPRRSSHLNTSSFRLRSCSGN